MTDNAFVYVNSSSLSELLHRRAIRHVRTRPYTPRTSRALRCSASGPTRGSDIGALAARDTSRQVDAPMSVALRCSV